MRIGMVCPYSFDVPGGVQFHVRDLAEVFLAEGHEVSVLAPADQESHLPPYLTPCGRAVPVRYNGSVARLNFGPVTSARVTRWLEAGAFEVVHLHEPVTPSVSLMALWAASQASGGGGRCGSFDGKRPCCMTRVCPQLDERPDSSDACEPTRFAPEEITVASSSGFVHHQRHGSRGAAAARRFLSTMAAMIRRKASKRRT